MYRSHFCFALRVSDTRGGEQWFPESFLLLKFGASTKWPVLFLEYSSARLLNIGVFSMQCGLFMQGSLRILRVI